MKAKLLIATVAVSAALAACGGGGSDAEAPPTATNEVPASASASVQAYSEYAGSMSKSETTEPLETNKVTPPTSETDSPISVG